MVTIAALQRSSIDYWSSIRIPDLSGRSHLLTYLIVTFIRNAVLANALIFPQRNLVSDVINLLSPK